jgi:hypothetical protein
MEKEDYIIGYIFEGQYYTDKTNHFIREQMPNDKIIIVYDPAYVEGISMAIAKFAMSILQLQKVTNYL